MTSSSVLASGALAAIEYNVGRTGHQIAAVAPDAVIPTTPLSATALRVLAALTGLWLVGGQRGCNAITGTHPGGCPHRTNRTPFRLSNLATDVFGVAGGTQVDQARRALVELAGKNTFFEWRDSGGRHEQRAHILSCRLSNTHVAIRGTGEFRWDPFLLDGLLQGRVQLLPAALVTGLRGRTAFPVWMEVLVRPRTARLKFAGDRAEYSVSGRDPLIPPARLHLGRLPERRLRLSLERASAAGNELQARYGLEVERRVGGGLKLCLTLLETRPSAHRVPSDGMSVPSTTAVRA